MTNKEKHMKLLEMAIDRGFMYCLLYNKNVNSSDISDPSNGFVQVAVFYEDWPADSSCGFDAAVKKIEEYKS